MSRLAGREPESVHARVAIVLGGSHADRPLVDALRAAGRVVVTVGGDPEGLAHLVADRALIADYSDPGAVKAALGSLQPELIVAGANDFAALTANAVGHHLGLTGLDEPAVCERFHRKDLFRRAARDALVPIPRQIPLSPQGGAIVGAALPLPAVVKPVDLTGGKGVEVVYRSEDFRAAARRAARRSRSGEAIAEQFVVGKHHGVSALISGQTVRFVFFDDELYRPGSYEVAAALAPTSLSPALQSEVVGAIERMAVTWRLEDGIVHLQLVERRGEWFVIDTCRRIPGDHYPDLVKLWSGTDYLQGLVALWLKHEWEPRGAPSARTVLRLCVLAPGSGFFRGIELEQDHSDLRLERLFDVIKSGTKVVEGQKVAIVLLSGPPGHVWGSVENIERSVFVQIDPVRPYARG